MTCRLASLLLATLFVPLSEAQNLTWSRQLGTGQLDTAGAAAADGAGGVFVGGYTEGSLGGTNAGGRDAWLAHYDGAGHETWIRQLGTSQDDRLIETATDGAGGVFTVGDTRGSLGGPNSGGYDAWLAHYDGTGNQTWIRQLGSDQHDHARAAAPDGAGGVFVSGYTGGSLGGPISSYSDAWTAHYDSAGNRTWIRQLSFSWDSNAASAATPDGSGGVYVSGSAWAQASSWPYLTWFNWAWLAHYDSAGNQSWLRQLGRSSGYGVGGSAPDGAGGVYVSGGIDESPGGPSTWRSDAWIGRHGTNLVTYCQPAAPNSSGQPGRMRATGSYAAADNDFTIVADQISLNSFGFFITSRTQGLVVGAGGSQGNLCLGGQIGRFAGPGQIQSSGPAGRFALAVDLSTMPMPTGLVMVQPGDTWNFQAWYRDTNPGPTSNFTDAVSVTFQ